MTDSQNVHVFVSADAKRMALSMVPDEGNLPSPTGKVLALALVPKSGDYLRST